MTPASQSEVRDELLESPRATPPGGADRGPRRSRRRDLSLSTRDGLWYGVMVGIGETYFAAFALALQLHVVAVGLIATVPILLGSILQLASPWGVQRAATYRWWVVGASAIQIASLWALIPLAFLGQHLTVPVMTGWLFASATIYWAGGLAASPAWNAWMEHLVPHALRPKYFAFRTRVTQASILAGIVMAGILLKQISDATATLRIFACLFAIGGACRLLSVIALARQSESHELRGRLRAEAFRSSDWVSLAGARPGSVFKWLPRRPRPALGLRSWLRMFDGWAAETKRLVVFLLAFQAALYFSMPFFTPYMLEQLELSHVSYMLLISLNFVGKGLALPWMGYLAKRFGAIRLLWIGAFGIAPISGLWLLSANIWYLSFLQLLTGVVWAGYELAILLMFFQQIPSAQRISVLTLFNFGNASAMVIGSLAGGWVLATWGTETSVYLAVFVGSTVLRFAALACFPRSLELERRRDITVMTQPIAVRPTGGGVYRPVVATIEEERPASTSA